MSEKDRVDEPLYAPAEPFAVKLIQPMNRETISQLGPGTFPVTSVQLDSVRLDSLGLVCHSPST
jgi:hypothetical protein